MNNNLVSVIIPLFNAEEYILETLNSVLNQTYRPIELIIVDDGSIDESKTIVEKFINENSSDSFIVTLNLNIKKGAPSARNYGLSISKGNYIQFLDADDLLNENKVLKQVQQIKEESVDIVYSKAQHIDSKGGLLPYFWGRKLQGNSSDYFEFPWQTMCALYKKETIYEIGLWNEDLNMNQDWEFSLMFVVNKCKIFFIDSVQSYYRTGLVSNIGKTITSTKIDSKYISTVNIYNLNKNKGNLYKFLKSKFLKRFIFIVIEYGKLSEWKKIKKVSLFLKEERMASLWLLWLLSIKSSFMFKQISNLYNTLTK